MAAAPGGLGRRRKEGDLRLYSDDQKICMQLWSSTRHREYIGDYIAVVGREGRSKEQRNRINYGAECTCDKYRE